MITGLLVPNMTHTTTSYKSFPSLYSCKDPTVYIFWRVLFYQRKDTRGETKKDLEDCYNYTDLFVFVLIASVKF